MGDKQDGSVLLFHVTHDFVDDLPPSLGKRCRRLIYDQKFRLFIHRACDFHQLSVLKAKHRNRQIRLHSGNPDLRKRRDCFRIHCLFADQTPSDKYLFFSHKNIFRHRNARYGSHLLNHHADAVPLRFHHAVRLKWFSLQDHGTAVRFLHSCNDGRQCGLAGTVFPDQPSDLSCSNFYAHTVQRFCRSKGFLDVVCLQ